MKPHKHAELIKAWADGAKIQGGTDGKHWLDLDNPSWDEEGQYRIKPNKRKYRVAEMFDDVSALTYSWTVDDEKLMLQLEDSDHFIRWLTDWIEYDATNTETK